MSQKNSQQLHAHQKAAPEEPPAVAAPDHAHVVHEHDVPVQERKLEHDESHEEHQVRRERRLVAVDCIRDTGAAVHNIIIVIRSEPRKSTELEKHRRQFCEGSNQNGLSDVTMHVIHTQTPSLFYIIVTTHTPNFT